MTTRIQITIDASDPELLVRFWATALHYDVEPAPNGAASWREYWLSIGVPEDELGDGDCADSIVDPAGITPRIWFQLVPEAKSVKNRVHLDLDVTGGRSVPIAIRQERVDAEVARLTQAGATVMYANNPDGVNQYAFTMQDPEGNEFCVG
jgi:hypothetical protein